MTTAKHLTGVKAKIVSCEIPTMKGIERMTTAKPTKGRMKLLKIKSLLEDAGYELSKLEQADIDLIGDKLEQAINDGLDGVEDALDALK